MAFSAIPLAKLTKNPRELAYFSRSLRAPVGRLVVCHHIHVFEVTEDAAIAIGMAQIARECEPST